MAGMVVRTECRGRVCTGVSIGDNDVRRYFPQQTESIDLELDHLLIRCGLSPGFWNGHSEISDPRLCAWLESKTLIGGRASSLFGLVMIPSGKNSFRLKASKASKGTGVSATPQFELAADLMLLAWTKLSPAQNPPPGFCCFSRQPTPPRPS